MGLINETVIINWNRNVKKHYISKGYSFTNYGDYFEVKVEDLTDGCHIKVNVKCDYEDCKNPYLKPLEWANYLKYVESDGKYYCHKCSVKKGVKNRLKTLLNNGVSFKQWCIKNDKIDILGRWDYELNDCKPNEILCATSEKYYFKCPKGIHKSELKSIHNIKNIKVVKCNQCNSFAQWGIDNLGEDFLEKYWDWEKNTVDPWKIDYSSSTNKIWIKCQEKDYHESYPTSRANFIKGNRCPYCNPFASHGKIHPLDSLGKLLEDKGLLHLWSKKNEKSPYKYSLKSGQYVWWKCKEGKHKDYKRQIRNSNVCNFSCPECNYFIGEEAISDYFINKEFIKISQKDFEIVNKDKYNKNYFIFQKTFDGLIGLGNGLLSYDFYLPNYNLLIEFQGKQHEKYIKYFHNSYEDFEKQLEHDRRKSEYAKINNIKLLEIWYYDFDNIENILSKYIK